MEKITSPKKSFIDFATALTIAGILLYYLGWMYWEKYFLTLSIKPSFIDISFDKIIVTTWMTIISLVLSFIFTFQQIYEYKKQKEIELFDLIWIFLVSIYIACTFKIENYRWYITFGGIAVYLIIKVLQRFKIIPQIFLSKQKSLIIIFIAIYLFGIYYYREKGEKDAQNLKDKYYEDIELKMESDKKIHGKFVIFMNNKYFIMIEDSKCKKETIIINDNDVREAKFID